MSGVEEDISAPAVTPARGSKRRNDHLSSSDLTEAKTTDTNRDDSLPLTIASRQPRLVAAFNECVRPAQQIRRILT